MGRVIYSKEASDELLEIVRYISNDKPIAAQNWLEKMRATCELLASRPKIGERHRSARIKGKGKRIPGEVVFAKLQERVARIKREDGIEVSRVLHGSRIWFDI